MAKTNYNKVESAIEKGLHDLKVDSLLKEADRAQGKGKKGEEKEKHTPKQMMTIIEQELKWMYKQDKSIYKILKLKRKKVEDLIKLVNTPDVKIKNKELKEIEELRQAVDSLKKNKFPSKTDKECLVKEIDRHIYKRHNVSEEWLPLDTHADWDRYDSQVDKDTEDEENKQGLPPPI